MEEHSNYTEAGVEGSHSGDLVRQLMAKLKTQSQRINQLESYKLLCEERILDFCPEHTFPVVQENIGSKLLSFDQMSVKTKSPNPDLPQTPESKRNGGSYNKLHEMYLHLQQKHNETAREKSELEEILRNEMIASEEQRAYIEVLKQAVGIRTESLCLKGIKPKEFAEYSKAKITVDESRREKNKINAKLSEYETQIKQLNDNLQVAQKECAGLLSERDELNGQLHQAVEALQYAEEEVQKLEEEKSNLIEYVESQNKVEQALSNELKQCKYQGGILQDENHKFNKALSLINEENRKLAFELDYINKEFYRNEKALKECQQAYSNLKSRIEEKDIKIQKYKNENNEILIQNAGLQAENITLAGRLAKAEAEIKIVKLEIDELKSEASRIGAVFEKQQQDKQESEHILQRFQEDLEKHKEKESSLSDLLCAATSELLSLQTEKSSIQEKMKLLSDQNDCMRLSIQSLEAEKNDSISHETSSNLKILHLQQQTDELIQRLGLSEQKLKAAESKLEEVNSMLETERETFRIFQDENYELKFRIEDLNKTFEIAEGDFKMKESEFKSTEDELNSLSLLVAQTHEDLAKEKYEKTAQYEELCIANAQKEKMKTELNIVKEAYDNACRVARTITAQLSPLNSSQFKKLSIAFAEQIPCGYDLNIWIEGAIKELYEITSKHTENTQIIDAIMHKNSLLLLNIENLNHEVGNLRTKEVQLKNSTEALLNENNYIKENTQTQISILQKEIIELRNCMQELHEENEQISSKNKYLVLEAMQYKSKTLETEQN